MITAKNLGYEYEDGRRVFSNVNFTVNDKEKIGIVGGNGSGKTTLLKTIAGQIKPTEGEIIDRGVEVGYMPQRLDDWVEFKVKDFLNSVTGVQKAFEELETLSSELTNDASEPTMLLYQAALDRVGRIDGDVEARFEAALRKAGIGDIDVDAYVGELSGGQRTKLALAATFASAHDVVLLDEPTNNLDQEGIIVLEKYIKNAKTSFVVVSHDRRFLRNTASTIIEMLGGDSGLKTYGLGYDEYVSAREAARESAFKRFGEYEGELDRLRSIARSARQTANSASRSKNRTDNDKLGFNAASSRAQASASKTAKRTESRLEKLRSERPDIPQERAYVKFGFGHEAESKFKTALSAKDLYVKYPTAIQELGPYNIQLTRGERVLLSGKNGAGKSTLLKAIFDPSMITGGQLNLASSATVGYMDQEHSLPDMTAGPVENIMQIIPGIDRAHATNLLVKFNVERDVYNAPVNKMSPGERAKILIAAIAYAQPDLLVLDEPTNHLDIPTIEAMELALKKYKGTMLIVSHDREFTDAIGISREQTILAEHA